MHPPFPPLASPLNWQKLSIRKKFNEIIKVNNFFSTSNMFNNINYKLIKMINYTTLKTILQHIVYITFFNNLVIYFIFVERKETKWVIFWH
jgi:hypothetical protein